MDTAPETGESRRLQAHRVELLGRLVENFRALVTVQYEYADLLMAMAVKGRPDAAGARRTAATEARETARDLTMMLADVERIDAEARVIVLPDQASPARDGQGRARRSTSLR